jgi:hypothetical protein
MFALKDLVAKGKVVRFVCLMADSLWYESEDGFAFPVPLSETPGATFLAEDKALMYMRHIRKFLPVATGLEGGLAKSMQLAVGDVAVTFTHFKDNELWFKTADGFEFPVSAAAHNTVSAREDAGRFAECAERHRLMLENARQVA